MTIEIRVPQLPESVSDATLVGWHKKPGEAVRRDENLVDLETDKVVLEVPAPASGTLSDIKVDDGTTVAAGDLLALLEEGEAGESAKPAEKKEPEKKDSAASEKKEEPGKEKRAVPDGTEKPQKSESAAPEKKDKAEEAKTQRESANDTQTSHKLSPAVRRLIDEHDLDATIIEGTGKDGRITKSDVMSYLKGHSDEDVTPGDRPAPGPSESGRARNEERVPMTRLRKRIAERMVEAQHSAAMLTTFNEVDLGEIMALRKRYRDAFEKEHGVRLGFMSFFVKASVEALKKFPVVNASVEDSDIVYHDYFDIGIAVSSDRGLLVPVVRDVDQLSFAQIESDIAELGQKAREGKISMDDLTGGTFTITNGGIFGSMLSTPILNPPQSAILGMHAIQERPMVIDGEIKIRPMMYVALTYDHRIIDGREAVQFLVTVKNVLEDPGRLLLQI